MGKLSRRRDYGSIPAKDSDRDKSYFGHARRIESQWSGSHRFDILSLPTIKSTAAETFEIQSHLRTAVEERTRTLTMFIS